MLTPLCGGCVLNLDERKVYVVVTCCNRPWYLSACLQSLVEAGVKQFPIVVTSDHAPSEEHWGNCNYYLCQDMIQEHALDLDYFTSGNKGLGRALTDARGLVFDNFGADFAYFIEDDVVVTPSFFTVMESLRKWCEQFDNVGAVGAWCDRRYSDAACQFLQDRVHISNANWFAYGMHRNALRAIRQTQFDYTNTFLRIKSYSQRDHTAIRHFFRQNWANRARREYQSPFPMSSSIWDVDDWLSHDDDYLATGQDAALACALACAGYYRVSTAVSRMRNIGEVGHTTFDHQADLLDLASVPAANFSLESESALEFKPETAEDRRIVTSYDYTLQSP